MAIEIERKFLVGGDGWRRSVSRRSRMRQGYLSAGVGGVVRVRIADDGATLTVKGPRRASGRAEFEYPVPPADAEAMLRLCPAPPLEKVRHWVRHAGRVWHVDVYGGAVEGLVVAEIELGRADEPFARPAWLGAEVTHDPRYSNTALWRGAVPKRPPHRPLIRGAALERAPALAP